MARTIGIEFEFAANQGWDEMRQLLESKGLDVNIRGSYCHSSGSEWELKTDSTACFGGREGFELASRILRGDDNLIELYWYAQALDNLRSGNDWKIHRGCGLHVHVDVSDFDFRDMQKLVKLTMHYEKALLALQPPSRRRTDYCRSIQDGEYMLQIADGNESRSQSALERIQQCGNHRTMGLNVINYTTRGTVEFRYSASTLNPNKVLSWVAVVLGLVEKAKHSRSIRVATNCTQRTLLERKNDLRKMVGKLRGYYGSLHKSGMIHRTIEERFEKFAGTVADRVPHFGRGSELCAPM